MRSIVFQSVMLLASSLVVQRSAMEEAFHRFIIHYNRSYQIGSGEYLQRLKLFAERQNRIELLNARPKRSWTAGVSPLADYTAEEFKMLRGWKGTGSTSTAGSAFSGSMLSLDLMQRELPSEWMQWTKLKAFEVVANQGACGSCWAMATANVLNSHREIYHNITELVSAQELVDCVGNPHHCGGSGGCNGATTELAMAYVMQNGLSKDVERPYLGFDDACMAEGKSRKSELLLDQLQDESMGFKTLKIHGWQRLPENQMEPLKLALVQRGPVAVSVAAAGWDLYDGGIYDSCEPDAVIDHAVTLIGYGEDQEKVTKKVTKYWTILNSWGKSFGEGGTMRLLRHDGDDHCGIDHKPQMGTACDGGPSEVKVCGMCGILYDSVVPIFHWP